MFVEGGNVAKFPLRRGGSTVEFLLDELFEERRAVFERELEVAVTKVVRTATTTCAFLGEDGVDLGDGDFMELAYAAVDGEAVEMGNEGDVFQAVLLMVLFLPDPDSFLNIINNGRAAITVSCYWCIGYPQLSFASEHVNKTEISLVGHALTDVVSPVLALCVHLEDVRLV